MPLKTITPKSLPLLFMPLLLYQKDVLILTDLLKTLQYPELSNQLKNKMFSLSEMISNLDRLKLKPPQLTFSSTLVLNNNLLFLTTIQETMMDAIYHLKLNLNLKKLPKNHAQMISQLPTKYCSPLLPKLTTKLSLNTYLLLVTPKKLLMNT